MARHEKEEDLGHLEFIMGVNISLQPISQAVMLIQDIIDGVIQTGRPPYPDSMFVDEGFRFFEPKKKERLLGDSCSLYFPKNCYVGIFPSEYQFCSESSLEEFLALLEIQDPYDLRDKVKERFPGMAVGICGGYEPGKPSSMYNVFWLDEKTRIYYDPYEKVLLANVEPRIIVV